MIKKTIQSLIRKLGYDIVKLGSDQKTLSIDFEKIHNEILKKVRPYTITSEERIYTLIESVKYILLNDIKGAFVECGVYKGGSMMAVALTLMSEGIKDRELYLFDTFEGMPSPGGRDVDVWGKPALKDFSEMKISDVSSTWVNASLASVKKALASTGYPMERVHFVKGLVENTIPEKTPEAIALLRLDTDWYESTLHELTNLYPFLSLRGIAIIDDFGHYRGAREAVEEYFRKVDIIPFLHRIDYTGRLILKTE